MEELTKRVAVLEREMADLPNKEIWFCQIEFTFPCTTEPSKVRYPGDADVDFARRAFEEGLRQRLSLAFPGNDGIHWTVVGQPKRES